VSSHVVDPILLASTSPQRRVILEQLDLPFDVVAPDYEEHDPPGADVYDLVREHARGKARSVAQLGGLHRPVLGVDTAVAIGGAILGKPANAAEAAGMLERLSGKTHVVVSGLCLLTAAWEVVEHAVTSVAFRELTPREKVQYIAALWDRVVDKQDDLPLSSWQRELAHARLTARQVDTATLAWSQVRSELESKLR